MQMLTEINIVIHEIICIKKKFIKAIAKIFFKMDCFFLLIYMYIYIYIYVVFL